MEIEKVHSPNQINIIGAQSRKKINRKTFTPQEKEVALKFGEAYWDDPNFPAYGGHSYDGRWREPAQKLLDFYQLPHGAKVLDVCCGKGYFLYELQQLRPDLALTGIDLSQYALDHAKEEIKECTIYGNATQMPFKDQEFDFAYSIDSLYILEPEDCKKAIEEMNRVSQRSFIQVMSYANQQEKENLNKLDISANTVWSVDEWGQCFSNLNYRGHWFCRRFL